MKLRDYLELRKKGWRDSAEDLSDIAVIVDKYRAKITELESIIESLDDKTLDAEIVLKAH